MVGWFTIWWVDHPEVIEHLDNFRIGDEEVLTQSMVKEATCLTKTDVKNVGIWLMQQSRGVDKKSVNELLKRLRIRRYGIWGLLHPQNPYVHRDKSMCIVSSNRAPSLFLFQELWRQSTLQPER